MASTAFLREQDYLDRGMVKRYGDVLLGDLLSQTGGRLLEFPPPLRDMLHISDGARRGSGEGADGVPAVDPVTGFGS